jgi:hypothetical protein
LPKNHFLRETEHPAAAFVMRMRTTHAAVIAALCLAPACEKDPRSEPSPEPIVVAPPKTAPAPKVEVPRPAISARVETVPAIVEPTRTAPPPRPLPVASGDLPVPPSVEPKAYAAWLKALPKPQQRQIAKFCTKHRTDFQESCGGIGPLHIPYPPFLRARAPQPGDLRSLFASSEEWSASLTSAQKRYIDRECTGGEGRDSSALCGDNTPLVVAFDSQPIEFTRGASFAFQAGAPTATDWPTATTPWIAFDANGDGTIDRGSELFGSETVLPGGTTAVNGFVALAALDANHDGAIDAMDPQFAKLVLWADRDADGKSSTGELAALSTTIVSISLAAKLDARCDARGNCEGERATLTWRDARGALHTGTVVDVYLPLR